jgi:SAM-dependent methyltransferase
MAERGGTGSSAEMAHSPTSRCIVCGGDAFHALYPVSDTNQGVPGEWKIIQCNDCRLGVLSPFPEQAEVASFYRDQFYTTDGKRFRGWVEWIRLQLARQRGRTLNRLMRQKGNLLDFGSGAGHFAAAQRDAGWQVWAIDPYSRAAEHPDKVRLDGDKIVLDFPDGFFDAVTLWYVIEHLRDPIAAIREFHRLLRPGGCLVLSQQDFASLQARTFGPRWLYLDPPRHLWQFNETNLGRLARDLGLQPLVTSHASIESGPFTILQSTLNVLLGNENYLFRLLKSGSLRAPNKGPSGRITPVKAAASVLLSVLLAPFSLLAYWLLLLGRSGDVFTLYLIRDKMPAER